MHGPVGGAPVTATSHERSHSATAKCSRPRNKPGTAPQRREGRAGLVSSSLVFATVACRPRTPGSLCSTQRAPISSPGPTQRPRLAVSKDPVRLLIGRPPTIKRVKCHLHPSQHAHIHTHTRVHAHTLTHWQSMVARGHFFLERFPLPSTSGSEQVQPLTAHEELSASEGLRAAGECRAGGVGDAGPALAQACRLLSPGQQLPCAEAAGFSAEDPLPGTQRQCSRAPCEAAFPHLNTDHIW